MPKYSLISQYESLAIGPKILRYAATIKLLRRNGTNQESMESLLGG